MRLFHLLEIIEEKQLFRIDKERTSENYEGETETVNIFEGRKADAENENLKNAKVKEVFVAFNCLYIII